MNPTEGFDEVIAKFGATATAKLSNPAASGAPEDQLRAPLERLLTDMAGLVGVPAGMVVAVGESSLTELKTRPDYAVTLNRSLVGFIEVKAPGKGADPRRFQDHHDQQQWEKLRTLPNLMYTDGNAFSLWRDGALAGRIIFLEGDIGSAGKKLVAPPSLLTVFSDFLQWQPQPPRTAQQLAELSARLCRLLREEVTEQLGLGSKSLTSLAEDWRKLLFPEASDEAFADGYAQAVTFGLLMARARNIPLGDGLDMVAHELQKTDTLIGAALHLLTDDADNQDTLKTSIATLTRVLDVVHWPVISKGHPEAWLYFYEEFLSVYDNVLRKKTGSYYTPPEVVRAMVRLVDEALRSTRRFGLHRGLGSRDVTIADPATGTSTYLLAVLRHVAEATAADQGPGAVPGAVQAALDRIIGFEIQFGPYAVAQLRILAEVRELMALEAHEAPPPLRLYVTDTLGNPFVEEEWIPAMLKPLAQSRRLANEIKRLEPITVVIGNPPYKEKAKGRGGWIEAGGAHDKAPLQAWMPPPSWKVGAHAKHLRNLYVYFWRWATWKVFGDGGNDGSRGRPPDRKGIVCFITVAGFLNGPGFQKMRADLRDDADEIWVIDCSPEGHQPSVSTRVFQGVQQPVCIVMAVRLTDEGTSTSAQVRCRALPLGDRKDKFAALARISLGGDGWADCPAEARASFFPKAGGAWNDFAALDDLFVYSGSGVMPGRTWVVAPDPQSLDRRWRILQREKNADRKEALFHPHLLGGKLGDKHVRKELRQGLHGHEYRSVPVASDEGPVVRPVGYAFRTFDRQWIIPDARLLNRPNPALWSSLSSKQLYLTAPHDRTPASGPSVSFTCLVPDLHHYAGRGGRVFPLWSDRAATTPNIKPTLLSALAALYGATVTASDALAYIAAVAAQPAYIERFRRDLVQPGLRIPFTSEPALFAEAAELGREVIWLHTFGERFADCEAGRPDGPPRLPAGAAPMIPKDGAIPNDPDRMPEVIDYDAGRHRLFVGRGHIDNVPQAVWDYEVSGKQVLVQWFSYRRRDRSRPVIGDRRAPSPLDKIQPPGWPGLARGIHQRPPRCPARPRSAGRP